MTNFTYLKFNGSTLVNAFATNLSDVLLNDVTNAYKKDYYLNNKNNSNFNGVDGVLVLIENERNNNLMTDNDHFRKGATSFALMLAACAILLSCCACCHFSQLPSRRKRRGNRSNNINNIINNRTLSQRRRRYLMREGDSSSRNSNLENADRTHNSEPDIIRRYDLDVESLPSYTLVSGLPTYDDALEQFRKSGILIQQPSSVIHIFENVSKKSPLGSGIIVGDSLVVGGGGVGVGVDSNIISNENTGNNETNDRTADSVSINSCNCGGSNGTGTSSFTTATKATTGIDGTPSTLSQSSTTLSTIASVIELNPEQLRILGQKRLSLQIALNSSLRHGGSAGGGSGGRIDLCREVNRNNLLRSHDFPQIHRSTASLNNERSKFALRLKRLQHRGSLT